MVDKTGLESLCEKANTKAEYLIKTVKLFQKDFKPSYREDREKLLQNFDPIRGAEKIVDTIFKE
jgi:benzoyl-CoA reductase/2-hydroxyglutaryl-CoA dehydratase subunit BcrC/BadD/HgdB